VITCLSLDPILAYVELTPSNRFSEGPKYPAFAIHFSDFTAPAALHELAGHTTHAVVPAEGLYVLTSHAAHVPDTALSSWPAGQLLSATAD
jgi:hypothetical protein